MNYFTFDNVDSRTYNTYVTASNLWDSPEENIETISVPYSNNIFYISNGTFKPFALKVTCLVYDSNGHDIDDLRNFLQSRGKQCKYVDSSKPNEYRVARFKRAFNIRKTDYDKMFTFELEFECMPQRYLVDNTTITRSATSTTTTDEGMTFASHVYPLPIDLKGNITQTTYSGKNLEQGIEQGGIDSNGADYYSTTVIRSKYYNDVSPSTQYIISMNGSVTGVNVAEYNSSKGFLSFTFRSGAFTTSATTKYIRISKTATANDKFQIEQGSTVTPYEPYVGGMPSPNQSYPQTIHTVSGDNDILVMGKNLISNVDIYNGYAYANDGATLTYISSDKTITYKKSAKVMAGTQYTLSWKPNTPKLVSMRDIKIADDDAKQLQNIQYSNSNNVKSVSFTPTYSGWVYACLDANATEPMLEVGSTATTYEEYKGITYHFPLPVENLWNENTQVFTNQSRFDNPTKDNNNKWTFTSNSSGYAFATSNITLSAGTYTVSATVNNGDFLLQKNGTTITNTFTITEETQITFRVYKSNATSGDIVTLSKVLVERGSKANTYTPYGTTPIELNKIGTYQDYFYKNGNKWYLHKETKRIVVDENSQVWRERATSPYIFAMQVNDYKRTQENICVCDYFTSTVNGSYAQMQNGEVKFRYYNDTQNRLYFCTTDYSTLSDFTTWLSTHNVTVIYALRTATNTEITDATLLSQLNAIDNVMAFETSTTITQVNNDAPFLLTYTNIGSANVSSDYRGEPIITVNETGLIYINGVNVKVLQAPMTINSQTMQAYNGNINLNNYIEINEFPMIEKGNNEIGSTMALSIVPNYWKL